MKNFLYVSRVRLENVRCFDDIELTRSESGDSASWTAILDDNATGKSAHLRAIAMGRCDQSSTAGLMKESDEGYVRRGTTQAKVTISLRDPDRDNSEVCITTNVIRESGRRGILRLRTHSGPSRLRYSKIHPSRHRTVLHRPLHTGRLISRRLLDCDEFTRSRKSGAVR